MYVALLDLKNRRHKRPATFSLWTKLRQCVSCHAPRRRTMLCFSNHCTQQTCFITLARYCGGGLHKKRLEKILALMTIAVSVEQTNGTNESKNKLSCNELQHRTFALATTPHTMQTKDFLNPYDNLSTTNPKRLPVIMLLFTRCTKMQM